MENEVELLKKQIVELQRENEILKSGNVFTGSSREHDLLLRLFDSVKEYVYVADMETYELLYVNRTL